MEVPLPCLLVCRQVIYEKLPSDIANRHVLLLDPIVACGTPHRTSTLLVNRFMSVPGTVCAHWLQPCPRFPGLWEQELNVNVRSVFLCSAGRSDSSAMLPVLASAGSSALKAIETLIAKGVQESHIIFLNLISVSFAPAQLLDAQRLLLCLALLPLRFRRGHLVS